MAPSIDSTHPSDLEQQLAEKDELINVLTGQLELAAERLDRLRRMGADRPAPAAGTASGTVPTVESSPNLGTDLQDRLTSILDQWEDSRPIDRLDRIDSHLERLLELISQAQLPLTSQVDELPPMEEETWEQARSRMMQGDRGRHFEPAEEFPADEEEFEASPEDAPPAPVPVQPENDAATLFSAVESRDTYILYLTERLRRLERSRWGQIPWQELQSVPDQFRQKIEQLEETLQEQLKRAEIAHALERADLTRERARLNQMKQNLEHQIKRITLGSSSTNIPALKPPQAEIPEQPTKPEPEKSWKRLFSR